MWVFDDERVGLDKEPFVAGADTLIDIAIQLKGIPNAAAGFLMVFWQARSPTPTSTLNGCGRKAAAMCTRPGLKWVVPCRRWKAGSAPH